MSKLKNIEPPKHLSEEALEWWDKYVPILNSKFDLEETDLIQMEMMAVSYGLYKLAYKRLVDCDYITTYKNGATQISQYHVMLHQNINAYNSIAKEYGLSPLSKAKLNDRKNKANNSEEGLDQAEINLTRMFRSG